MVGCGAPSTGCGGATSTGGGATIACGTSTLARFFGGACAGIATATGEGTALTIIGEATVGTTTAAGAASEDDPTERATAAAPIPTVGSSFAPMTDTLSCAQRAQGHRALSTKFGPQKWTRWWRARRSAG